MHSNWTDLQNSPCNRSNIKILLLTESIIKMSSRVCNLIFSIVHVFYYFRRNLKKRISAVEEYTTDEESVHGEI